MKWSENNLCWDVDENVCLEVMSLQAIILRTLPELFVNWTQMEGLLFDAKSGNPHLRNG